MKRWPLIRHVRWAWHAWRFSHWWETWGRYLGAVPNPQDLRYLEDVWDGHA